MPVESTGTATDLFHKTLSLYGPIALESLDLIESGRTDWIKQDRSKASFFHKRSIEDGRVDWTWPARDIANLVRAQSDPYPNAFTYHDGATAPHRSCVGLRREVRRNPPGPDLHPAG